MGRRIPANATSHTAKGKRKMHLPQFPLVHNYLSDNSPILFPSGPSNADKHTFALEHRELSFLSLETIWCVGLISPLSVGKPRNVMMDC